MTRFQAQLWLTTAAMASLMLSAPAGDASRPVKRRLKRKVVATGYCLGPCRRCETQGLTSTGTRGRRGVAVARRGRRVLPLGSHVYVPGYGWAAVDDVGGGVGSTQIDVRFRTHSMASRWGKKNLQVVALVPR